MLTDTPEAFPRQVRTGVYGRFVCLDCEQSFNLYDSYAKEFLHDGYEARKKIQDGSCELAFQLPAPDYERLKLFFMITLWRAHWCAHEMYSRVRLGSKEVELRRMVRAKDAGPPDDWSVVLATFDHPAGSAHMDPFVDRFANVRTYRFYMGRYIATIKADQRPLPHPLRSLQIRPREPVAVVVREFRTSIELQIMQKIIKATRARGNPWGREG